MAPAHHPDTPSAVQTHASGEPVWRRFDRNRPYKAVLAEMEKTVDSIVAGTSTEMILLGEHAPVITAGTSAIQSDLLNAGTVPIHSVGRGGQYTWHGPGQRIAYLMLDLNRRKRDVRLLVQALEDLVSLALADFGVSASPRVGRVGLWVDRTQDKGRGHEDKIAAIGIRIRRWVSFHGVAINVNPDLTEFDRIVPCGIADARFGVTSLADLGVAATMDDLDRAFKRAFPQTIDRLLPQASY